MTMDNGEGRPLDEVEAGNDDPQGWYFDLPGGAWERQEEKNRTLRQRVLGNLSEDEEKSRSDPFGRKPQEPDNKDDDRKGGRGFFGRKKKEDDRPEPRISAGGTWKLNRGSQPADPPPPAAELTQNDDADDWSTEPPLKLSPFPRSESASIQPWGEPEAGWELSAPETEIRGAVAEPAIEAIAETVAPGATDGWREEPDDATQDFLASMRTWAAEQPAPDEPAETPEFRAPTLEEVAASEGWAEEPDEPDSPLTLRPRQREDDGKQLDWNFGPAAWSDEPADAAEERAAFVPAADDESAELNFESMHRWAEESHEKDHPHFVVHHQDAEAEEETPESPVEHDQPVFEAPPAADFDAGNLEPGAVEEESALESMRRWAERNRDADHPHFAVTHHESDDAADDEPRPLPIPLRPRTHDDVTPPSSFAPVPPSPDDDTPRLPLQLPIVRRSHDQDEAPVQSEKWNDFFAIKPAAEEESESAEEGPSDGLSAMRAWAQQRPEATPSEDIPEEFLKPFDWELEESSSEFPGTTEAALEVPAEFLKPFDWEEGEPETPAFEAPEAPIAPTFEVPFAVPESAASQADDPLDGIFPAAASQPQPAPKKKGGRFGRLFGRGKNKEHESEVTPDAEALGDWLLPGNDDNSNDDIRVAARTSDWTEDAGTLEAPEALKDSGEGWGASLSEGWSRADRDAIAEFADAVVEPASEWAPEPETVTADETRDEFVVDDDQVAEIELLVTEPVAEAEAVVVEPVTSLTPEIAASDGNENNGWDPEPVTRAFDWATPTVEEAADAPIEAVASVEAPVETVASVEGIEEPVAEEAPWWEKPAVEGVAAAPVEAVASVEAPQEPVAAETPWWEKPAVAEVAEAPVVAVASVEAIEEPVAEETPWWEKTSVEEEAEAPAVAVASVEVAEEPVAEETPWWEKTSVEEEAESAVQAVASVEAAEEPVAEETPWWEKPTVEEETEAPVDAVASVEAAEEPVAEETPWWEKPAVAEEAEAPVEAVASVEVAEEPATEETPWWEKPTAEDKAEAPVEAVASVEVAEEPVADDTPWWEKPTAEDKAEAPVEAVASVEVAEEPVADDTPWWEKPSVEDEPESPVEAVASVEASEEPVAEETPWWEKTSVEEEAEAPAVAVASVEVAEEPVAEETPWWEKTSVEEEAESAVQAVASVEAAEEPVAETPWWEKPAIDEEAEAPAVAVASVEASEEPVADESPWWEKPAVAEEAEPPVEAVASVEAAEEPVADDTPWWEKPAVAEEAEAPVEAVASVEVAEEPATEETPWWEKPAVEDEPEAPVEAVASVEVTEEPVADETPWWEKTTVEEETEAPVEAVASVEVAEEPVADDTPWWEKPAVEDEPEAPVEAAASVERAEEPATQETPWWEKPADEPEAAAEAVASVEATDEPVAEETPWWEKPAVEEEAEAPVEAVASVEAAEEPVAEETPWWQKPAVEDEPEAPVEAVASVEVTEEPVAEETSGAADDDDPWADFVSSPPAAPAESPATPVVAWDSTPATQQSDEDMWGHIASQAEEHAASDHQLDLAASLESQMAEDFETPAAEWPERERPEWPAPRASDDYESAFLPEHEDEDVILAAFERHAATPDEQLVRESDEVFAELLGAGAADIVAEASDDDSRESFLKIPAWPTQRKEFDGGWAPEQEVESALENQRPAFGGSDGAGFAPPPWAVEGAEGDAGDAEAAALAGGHHRTKTWVRELVETGLLALLVFLSVRASFQNFKVEGSSMYPTLENGQFLIVNKLVYSEVDMEKLSEYVPFVEAGSNPKHNVFHGPERGDIIVLKDPRDTDTDLIKRVIGLPGETIEITDGKVYINDRLLDEPYIKAVWHDSKPKILIPPGEFFVMGDNRDNSLDSRSTQVGLVPQDLIIGKAMLSYWPRDKFGLAANEEGKLGEEKPTLTTQRIGE